MSLRQTVEILNVMRFTILNGTLLRMTLSTLNNFPRLIELIVLFRQTNVHRYTDHEDTY